MRNIIDENIELYDEAKNRADKGRIIIEIVERLRLESPTGIGLVKYNRGLKRWSYIGKEKAKDKIGHALRKASQDKQKLLEVGGSIIQSQEGPLVAKKKKQAHQKQESGNAVGLSFIGDSSPLEEATFEFAAIPEHKQERVAVSQRFSKDSVPQYYSIDYISSKKEQEFAYPCNELQSRTAPQEVTSLVQSALESSSSSQQQQDSRMANSSNLMMVHEAQQLQQQGANAPGRLTGSQMNMAHINLSTSSSFTPSTAPVHLRIPTTLPSHQHQLQHLFQSEEMRMASELQRDDVSAHYPFMRSSLSDQLQSGNQQLSTVSLSMMSDQLVQQQHDNISISSNPPAPRFLHQMADGAASSYLE